MTVAGPGDVGYGERALGTVGSEAEMVVPAVEHGDGWSDGNDAGAHRGHRQEQARALGPKAAWDRGPPPLPRWARRASVGSCGAEEKMKEESDFPNKFCALGVF